MEFTDFSYNNGKLISEGKEVTSEIEKVIRKMEIERKTGRAFSEYFRRKLKESGWKYRGNVIPDLSIKFGFRKNSVELETQFGNIARFYSDIFKLQLSYNREEINTGILILPTKQLANQIGSNIASFDRAKEELVKSRPLYSVPLWLIGIKMKI